MVQTGQISADNLDVFMPLIPGILQAQALDEEGFRFYGISVDDEAAGIIVIRERADNADLRFMYLLPERRRMGYMDQALSTVLFDLHREGFTRVIVNYVPSEYEAVAHICDRFSFVKHKTDRAFFRFRAAQIRKCKAVTYVPQGIVRLRALPDGIKQELYKRVDTRGYDISHIIKNTDLRNNVEERSLVYMEGDKPMGLMLVQDMKSLPDGDKSGAFGIVFPEGASADIALIYIGSTQVKAPLYLVSALARDILTVYEENEVITGYFPESHLTKLLEGTLGVQAMREMTGEFILDSLESYYE